MDLNHINYLIKNNEVLIETASNNLEYHKNSVERCIKEIDTYKFYIEALKFKKEELENNIINKNINGPISSYFI